MKQSACLKVDLSEYIERLKAISGALQSALPSEDKDFDEQSVETIEKARTEIAEICTLCECISEKKYSANTLKELVTLCKEVSELNANLNLNQGFHPIMTDEGVKLISECEEAIKDGKSCASEIRGKIAPLRARISYLESCKDKISQWIARALDLISIAARIVLLFWKR